MPVHASTPLSVFGRQFGTATDVHVYHAHVTKIDGNTTVHGEVWFRVPGNPALHSDLLTSAGDVAPQCGLNTADQIPGAFGYHTLCLEEESVSAGRG